MIESIQFINFKALRQTTLPLAPFTLLLGPNGSGKSSVLQALQGITTVAASRSGIHGHSGPQSEMTWPSLLSVTAVDRQAPVQLNVRVRSKERIYVATVEWGPATKAPLQVTYEDSRAVPQNDLADLLKWLGRMQTYAFDFSAIAAPAAVNSAATLQWNGGGLAAVLDDLKDNHPERWDAMQAEMCRWLPEYDLIQFDKPQPGAKAIVLRTKRGKHRIPAKQLSQGTLVALTFLTLAYLPNPPSVVGLEEIDRGLHPRLLRHLQDALYRLSYPESCGETRPAIQVIATTHSPYLLDLYREHPEEVVLAQKHGLEVEMKRLTDIEHYDEILGDSPLSEVWYSGVLGGASVTP